MTESIEKMDAADCRERLEAIRARQKEISERVAEIREPKKHAPASGPAPGREYDLLEGAGPEFKRVALGDDPAELVELREERKHLGAAGDQLVIRKDALTRRLKAAEIEEARAAAPGELAEALASFPEKVEAVKAAAAALHEAEEALSATRRHIPKLRALTREETGEPAPGIGPEELRAYWSLVAPRKRDGTLQVLYRNDMTHTVGLHRDRKGELRDLLGPPDERLVARLRKRVLTSLNVLDDQGKGDLPEREVRRELDEVRGRLIASGELEKLADAHEVAVEAVQARHRGPGRTPPSREQAESWLARRRDDVAADVSGD